MNRLLSFACKIFLAPVFEKLFIKEIKGLENIPNSNFILASNHQSDLDILVNGYICVPRRFHFIGQIEGFKGIVKLFIYIIYFIFGVIPLDRKSKDSRKKVLNQAIDVLKKGDILIIYPEGRRTRTGKILKGKLGVAKIFLKTNIPILPVGIKGAFELLPPGGKLKIKRIIKINIGKPIFFEEEFERAKTFDENSKEYQEILRSITDKVMREIASLADQDY